MIENGPKPLWRNRDYVFMWSGQAISTVGTQITLITFPLLVLLITKSPAQAGFMGTARALPYLFFSLPAGALVDRWDRKRIMIVCDLGRALSLGSIPIAMLLGHLTLVQLYVNAIVEGTLFVFFNLAETACVPQVVAQEQVPSVMAQYQATEGVTSLLGPLLGGILFEMASMLPFIVDAASYFVSVCSLLFIKTKFQEQRIVPSRRLRTEITEGLIWIWKQPLIRLLAFLACGANIVITCYTLIVIVIAQSMHASSSTIGIIFAIGGSGGIIGALLGSPIQKRFRFGHIIICIWWLWSILWLCYAIVPNVLLLGFITAAFSLTMPIYNVVQFSYRLALIPDALQGRVNSAFRLLAFGGQPLGLALAGFLLQAIGPVLTILVFAAILIPLSFVTTINTHVRHASSLVKG